MTYCLSVSQPPLTSQRPGVQTNESVENISNSKHSVFSHLWSSHEATVLAVTSRVFSINSIWKSNISAETQSKCLASTLKKWNWFKFLRAFRAHDENIWATVRPCLSGPTTHCMWCFFFGLAIAGACSSLPSYPMLLGFLVLWDFHQKLCFYPKSFMHEWLRASM